MKPRDNCPECGGRWVDDDGGTWPNLCSLYDMDTDRTEAWACMHCLHRWPRNSADIYPDSS